MYICICGGATALLAPGTSIKSPRGELTLKSWRKFYLDGCEFHGIDSAGWWYLSSQADAYSSYIMAGVRLAERSEYPSAFSPVSGPTPVVLKIPITRQPKADLSSTTGFRRPGFLHSRIAGGREPGGTRKKPPKWNSQSYRIRGPKPF